MILFRSKYRKRIEAKIVELTMRHLKAKMDMSKIRLSNQENHKAYFRLMSEVAQLEYDIKLLKGLL